MHSSPKPCSCQSRRQWYYMMHLGCMPAVGLLAMNCITLQACSLQVCYIPRVVQPTLFRM